MCARASAPPLSTSSPFLILPGVFTQTPQSVLGIPFSTWNPALAEPQKYGATKETEAGSSPLLSDLSLEHATITAARNTADVRSLRLMRPRRRRDSCLPPWRDRDVHRRGR